MAPIFVTGGVTLTVFALATELYPGDHVRGTLALVRRQPGGLASAWTGKTSFFLLACLVAAVESGVTLALAAQLFGGPDVARATWLAFLGDPTVWLWPAAFLAFGLWTILVSTWIPRGAAAAGAAALLLGLLAVPAYCVHLAYPTYRPTVGFVRVALLCVKRNGKADLPDCDPGFTGTEIKFAMSCGGVSGAAAGCASLGYSARTFRLVQ